MRVFALTFVPYRACWRPGVLWNTGGTVFLPASSHKVYPGLYTVEGRDVNHTAVQSSRMERQLRLSKAHRVDGKIVLKKKDALFGPVRV